MAEPEEYQPKHIEMSADEKARLEAERADLVETMRLTRPTERWISGEGSALDPEPPVISIRERLAAQRRERGEPEEPVYSEPAFTSREQRRKLNVDPAKLAELVAAAQATADESALADELAESAGAAARVAREALDAYLEESGLAG